jgi:hypothetical protein
MSYREHEESHRHSEICGVPSQTRIHLLNGTAIEIVIPCSYVIPAVSESAEETYEPIHLTAEGYEDPEVAFADAPEGLTGLAWIDEDDDSKVHCVFSAQCPGAISVDIECETSVLITKTTGAHGVRTHCVLRGLLKIEDSPLP